MKKPMLYLSLAISVIYALAVCLVVVFQKALIRGLGDFRAEVPFMVPMADLCSCMIMAVLAVVLNLLLLRAADDMRTNMEMAALVVFSVLIIFMPWISNLGQAIQFRYYAYLFSAEAAAAYSLIHIGIVAGCNPFLVFAMLLQIIYAGISLGRKGR